VVVASRVSVAVFACRCRQSWSPGTSCSAAPLFRQSRQAVCERQSKLSEELTLKRVKQYKAVGSCGLVSDIAQAIGACGVIVSLILLTWQTKKLGKQIEISNLQGRYQTLHDANERYDHALGLIFAHPELRPYFYERQPCPKDDPNRPRALIVAEIIADAIDHALRVANQFPDEDHKTGWRNNAFNMAKQPIFIEVLVEFPGYFPDLLATLPERANLAEKNSSRPDPAE
jgi:hypothetical protein